MALIRCDFFSEVLELSTSMTVLLPQSSSGQIGLEAHAGTAPPRVLYLLHGLSDDDTMWLRRTSIERYVAPLGLAVVMPQVHRSFYTDQAHGSRYWTFLSEELPGIVAQFFRVSDRPQDTFVAGLSMGGYGALKWALRHPDRFAAAASLSGALDLVQLQLEGGRPAVMDAALGDGSVAGTPDDLFHLLEAAVPGSLPRLFVGCGAQDELLDHTRRWADRAATRGIPVTVDIGPGQHEWGYWDDRIEAVVTWMLS